jgi:hypothetical protein
MILTLTAISFFLISLVILIILKIKGDVNLFGWGIFFVIMSVLLFAVLLFLTLDPTFHRAEIAEFNSVQEGLNLSRSNPNVNQFELVAIQQKVIEKNEWLAKAQFWTRHKLTNWFWPKEILELKPIK